MPGPDRFLAKVESDRLILHSPDWDFAGDARRPALLSGREAYGLRLEAACRALATLGILVDSQRETRFRLQIPLIVP